MTSCLTQEYKSILIGLIDRETEKAILRSIIETIPLCAEVAPTLAAVEEAKATRKRAEEWGIEPVYIDEEGKETTFSSPTAAIKHLGLKVSRMQCDEEGKSCVALTLVDVLRIHGYTVTGDGEPKKASQGGLKMTIIHPKALKERMDLSTTVS